MFREVWVVNTPVGHLFRLRFTSGIGVYFLSFFSMLCENGWSSTVKTVSVALKTFSNFFYCAIWEFFDLATNLKGGGGLCFFMLVAPQNKQSG